MFNFDRYLKLAPKALDFKVKGSGEKLIEISGSVDHLPKEKDTNRVGVMCRGKKI